MKKLVIGNEAVAWGLYNGGIGLVSSYPGTGHEAIQNEVII